MTQFNLPTINPATHTGTNLADWLNQWKPAVHSSHAGVAAPAYAVQGMPWLDTSNVGTPNFAAVLKIYNGSAWVTLGTASTNSATWTLPGVDIAGSLGVGMTRPADAGDGQVFVPGGYVIAKDKSVLWNAYWSSGGWKTLAAGAAAMLSYTDATASFEFKFAPTTTAGAVPAWGPANLTIGSAGNIVINNGATSNNVIGTKVTSQPAHYFCGQAGNTTLPVVQIQSIAGFGPADLLRAGTSTTARLSGMTSAGTVFGTGPFVDLASFAAVKTEIGEIEDASAITRRLRPRRYRHTTFDRVQHGFLIEDLSEDLPEAVALDAQGEPEGYYATMIIASLVATVQDLLRRLDALEGAAP